MYEILNSFKQKPIPKLQQNSSILKSPKIFQKPQNLGFKTWNACKWEKVNLPSEEKNLKKLEKHFERGLEWERVFWEVKGWICWERDREKWEENRVEPLYRGSVKLDR